MIHAALSRCRYMLHDSRCAILRDVRFSLARKPSNACPQILCHSQCLEATKLAAARHAYRREAKRRHVPGTHSVHKAMPHEHMSSCASSTLRFWRILGYTPLFCSEGIVATGSSRHTAAPRTTHGLAVELTVNGCSGTAVTYRTVPLAHF
jgi:hypothetical protein